MSTIGTGLLSAVVLLYGFAAAFGLAASQLDSSKAARVLALVRRVALAASGLAVVLLAFFAAAFLTDDFSISAVASYGARSLPFFYKLSALWAGSAGSLLLWAVCASVIFALWLFASRFGDRTFDSASLAVGSAVCLGFYALLFFVAKPFAPATLTMDDGYGLNPQLMNFWMIIHPPLLFLGYAALLIPFVGVPAAVLAARTDDSDLLRRIRRWLLVGLCFLSAGIATGAKWSYVELGWGGYWAWDPVENASLLPWLLAMAALHALLGIRFSTRFRFLALLTLPLPFVLCLFATFITRSGILKSVHTFDRNPMFLALLLFMGLCVALWILSTVIAARRLGPTLPRLGTPVLDIAGLLFWANIIFIVTALIIGVATFWPSIRPIFTGSDSGPVVTRKFFDHVVSGAGPIAAFLIGLSILASFQSKKSFILYSLACSAAALLSYGFVLKMPENMILTALACGVSAFTLFSILIKMLFYVRTGGRIGGTITHLGLLVLVAAVALSSAEKRVQAPMTRGDSFNFHGYELVYDSFEHKVADGATRVGPLIVLKKDRLNKKLWPHRAIYANEQTASEVAVHTGLTEDLYLAFDDVTDDGKAVIAAKIIPGMFWIWFAFVLIVGGLALAVFETRRKRISRDSTLKGKI